MCDPQELSPAGSRLAEQLAGTIVTMATHLASEIVSSAARKAAADGIVGGAAPKAAGDRPATEYLVCGKCGVVTGMCPSLFARIQFARCGNCSEGFMWPVKDLWKQSETAAVDS